MDVPRLLVEARGIRGLTRQELAARAGTTRSAIGAYETGARVPSVRTLVRLIGACGLQVRAQLVDQHADVDALLDAAGLDEDHRATLRSLAGHLDRFEVVWAFDGGTALALQGVSVPWEGPELAVADGTPLRRWLTHAMVRGIDERGFSSYLSWHDGDVDSVASRLRLRTLTGWGALLVRPVTALPPTVPVLLDDRAVPCLPVPEVERASPHWAAVVSRWRERGR